MKHKKIIIRVISIIIIIVLIFIFSLSYTVNKSKNWNEKTINTIKSQTRTTDKINYINYYNNYYIYKTDKNIIVLNNEYKEVEKYNISDLKEIKKEYEIVYKTKKLMYERKIIKDNKAIYEYYDAKSGNKVSTIKMEKK